MTGGGYDIGGSTSASSGAQSGPGSTGNFYITGGGGGGSILPKVPATQAWVVYAVLGGVAIIGLAFFFKLRSK